MNGCRKRERREEATETNRDILSNGLSEEIRMVRSNVYLTESQKAQLQQISVARGNSVAQLIREAVDLFLHSTQSDPFERALEGAFGLWKDREIEDSTEYVRQLRKGWEDRLERMEIDGTVGR